MKTHNPKTGKPYTAKQLARHDRFALRMQLRRAAGIVTPAEQAARDAWSARLNKAAAVKRQAAKEAKAAALKAEVAAYVERHGLKPV